MFIQKRYVKGKSKLPIKEEELTKIKGFTGKAKKIICSDSINEIIYITSKIFKALKIPNPQQEANWMIEHIVTKNSSAKNKNITRLSFCAKIKLIRFIRRRIKGEPLAYILKEWNFYGYDFLVNTQTLIPRLDSEIIIEANLESIARTVKEISESRINIIDLCCGTGCLGITLYKELSQKGYNMNNILFIDINKKALNITKKNAYKFKLGSKSIFIKTDVTKENIVKKIQDYQDKCNNDTVYKEGKIKNIFFVICNPPYLTKEQMKLIAPSVHYEPKLALYGGEDGMYFYNKILQWLTKLHRKGARKEIKSIFFEIDPLLTDKIVKSALKNGFNSINIKQDMEGRDRSMEIKI